MALGLHLLPILLDPLGYDPRAYSLLRRRKRRSHNRKTDFDIFAIDLGVGDNEKDRRGREGVSRRS